MKSLLVFTRTTRLGGAERVVNRLRAYLQGADLRVDFGCVSERTADTPLGSTTALFGTYDLIHSHLFLPGLMIRVRRLFDRSFVWIHTVHYSDYESQHFPRLKRWLDFHFVYPEADRLVAVSESVARFLHSSPELGPQVRLIRNPGIARPTPLTTSPSTQVIRIGALSMLRLEKGLSDLIEAVHWLVREGQEVSLKIAGDGPERANLEALISARGLGQQVQLLGYVHDLDAFFRDVDLIAMPSKSESFGLAALDSLARGIPVVASDAGELPATLGHGRFGRIVPLSSAHFVAAFAKALQEVHRDLPRYRELALAGQRAHTESDPQRMEREYETLYRSLLRPGLCMVSPIVTHATGGIQRQLYLQTRELDRRGQRVFILQKQDPRSLSLREKWQHADFIETPTLSPTMAARSPWLARVDGALFILTGLWMLRRHRRQIQTIHAHQLFSPATLGAWAKIMYGPKLVVKVTASGAYGELSQLRQLPFFGLRQFFFRQIDCVIVLTENMREEMLELGFNPERIRLIPNSVEPVDTRSPDRSQARSFRVLFTGRISREKSLTTLISAAKRLAQTVDSLELILVGGTHGGRDDSAQMHKDTQHLPSNLRVVFTGAVENVDDYYRNADVFVLPSLSEGMSNALLEAMAYGLPCVVSDIAPNRFVVCDEEDGLLFQVANEEDLARQLSRLAPGTAGAAELRRKLGENARRTIERRFSVTAIGAQLTGLYSDIRRSEVTP